MGYQYPLHSSSSAACAIPEFGCAARKTTLQWVVGNTFTPARAVSPLSSDSVITLGVPEAGGFVKNLARQGRVPLSASALEPVNLYRLILGVCRWRWESKVDKNVSNVSRVSVVSAVSN